jgi:hypothetical protein
MSVSEQDTQTNTKAIYINLSLCQQTTLTQRNDTARSTLMFVKPPRQARLLALLLDVTGFPFPIVSRSKAMADKSTALRSILRTWVNKTHFVNEGYVLQKHVHAV